MDIEKIWHHDNWTQETKKLLLGLEQFPSDSKVILILRHSHREHSDDPWRVSKLKLTPLGHEIAKKFGENLPLERNIRLFYSFLDRCKETAESILKGFKNKKGIGMLMNTLDVLVDIGMEPDLFFNEITKYPLTKFFYRWIAGLYSSDIIMSFNKFCQQAAYTIWKEIEQAPDKGIDIHVSHDLIILCYKFGWFGLPPNDYWPSFLGGFAFSIIEDNILLYDNNGLNSFEIPYWWKNLD
ncbi:MAG: histidine phosphatase family protein [Candidatus Heimdallarchaeota archaeon]